MLKLLETLKDSAESALDSGALRVENIHRLISGYVGGQARRINPGGSEPGDDEPRATIYDVIRGVNREIGEFGTDVIEIIEDARARRDVDSRRDDEGE